LAVALATIAAPAAAEGHFSASVTAGTLGVGPELGYRLSESFGVRANAAFLGGYGEFESSSISYRGDIDLKSGGVMADLYPFGGGFRISAGARLNGSDGKIGAAPAGSVEIGANTYTAAQVGTLRGDIETRNFAPALTLGWGGGFRSGLTLGIEAGALFTGALQVRNFRSEGGTLSNDATFAADLEAERREIQRRSDDYKVYPIVQLTLGYRF